MIYWRVCCCSFTDLLMVFLLVVLFGSKPRRRYVQFTLHTYSTHDMHCTVRARYCVYCIKCTLTPRPIIRWSEVSDSAHMEKCTVLCIPYTCTCTLTPRPILRWSEVLFLHGAHKLVFSVYKRIEVLNIIYIDDEDFLFEILSSERGSVWILVAVLFLVVRQYHNNK